MFVGDDWAEDHHDVEVMDTSGRRLAKARLPEGVAGMTRLHAIIGELAGEDADEIEVLVGIETDRGPWVRALVAAGYTVLAVNPLQAARSQPGLGTVLGARVLAEFGDDPTRYATAKARKNYAGTSPITRASGKKKVALARFIHNDRLIDALLTQAFSALRLSPGARAYYDRQRARGCGHNAALRQLANRLVGILHGCLKTGTLYDEATAWSHHAESLAA
ncbi:transposase [Nonomuraea glycinis]